MRVVRGVQGAHVTLSRGCPARSLSENEEIITRGQRTFIEVGNALMEIREQRQYKDAGYSDFDTYCRERWGWERTYAHRLMAGAEVVGQLLPIGNTPQSESQARPLVTLRSDPPAMREAWQDAQRIAAEREKPVTQAIVQARPMGAWAQGSQHA